MTRKRLHSSAPQSTGVLREMTGRKHALLSGRGAAGMVAALRAFGLRDELVMIPANTCYIVLWAVLQSGNKPLLVDVNPDTGNWTVETLSSVGDQYSAKAMIPCHMYGLSAPIEGICQWARARGVYVIEDAALALGGGADGQPAGSWGDVSIFSFGLGKIADMQLGGAALTDDDSLAADIRRCTGSMAA